MSSDGDSDYEGGPSMVDFPDVFGQAGFEGEANGEEVAADSASATGEGNDESAQDVAFAFGHMSLDDAEKDSGAEASGHQSRHRKHEHEHGEHSEAGDHSRSNPGKHAKAGPGRRHHQEHHHSEAGTRGQRETRGEAGTHGKAGTRGQRETRGEAGTHGKRGKASAPHEALLAEAIEEANLAAEDDEIQAADLFDPDYEIDDYDYDYDDDDGDYEADDNFDFEEARASAQKYGGVGPISRALQAQREGRDTKTSARPSQTFDEYIEMRKAQDPQRFRGSQSLARGTPDPRRRRPLRRSPRDPTQMRRRDPLERLREERGRGGMSYARNGNPHHSHERGREMREERGRGGMSYARNGNPHHFHEREHHMRQGQGRGRGRGRAEQQSSADERRITLPTVGERRSMRVPQGDLSRSRAHREGPLPPASRTGRTRQQSGFAERVFGGPSGTRRPRGELVDVGVRTPVRRGRAQMRPDIDDNNVTAEDGFVDVDIGFEEGVADPPRFFPGAR